MRREFEQNRIGGRILLHYLEKRQYHVLCQYLEDEDATDVAEWFCGDSAEVFSAAFSNFDEETGREGLCCAGIGCTGDADQGISPRLPPASSRLLKTRLCHALH